ncbi:MAG: ATP-grasp domain protein [Candidatus Woesebacteria bacterium GW2011_GWA1_39_21]|uniref:ATP-grasp domain protein n=1 Tax=Candidatus Woesebacteria bacterium GW2011_GWA1_39_21 TaxID=1618550 RepID=A0A0G0QK68_9BACT|nr:MAG: ATP-grasp domain protein [Candidatus Woesebacteria bacterium GW2011_GWA1_39_21]
MTSNLNGGCRLKSAKDVMKLTKDLPDIVAVAPNAFSRVVPAQFFPNFSIVCFKYRQETDFVARDMEVFCAEKNDPNVSISKMNAKEMLQLPMVQKYINDKRDPHLLVYKPTKGVEDIAYQTGWKIIGNSATVKYDIENKLAFRNLLKDAGIEAITGETVLFDELDENLYKNLVEKYGEHLVFQVAEMTAGGGTGTAFINNTKDLHAFMEKFGAKKEMLTSIENINVTKFIEGVPTSVAACTTKFGVITGRIQTQILDIPEVRELNEGSGLFCGHDFSYGDFSEDLNIQAASIAKKIGEYIYKTLNYKGIFGLDLITNVEEGKVYVVECNPRYTDAFPLLSEIYNSSSAIPMDVFHILEHMNVPYEIDVDEVTESYRKTAPASQIILETKRESATKVTGDLQAGVYKINQTSVGKDQRITGISFLRSGYRFEDLKDEDEFLVTEGVPFKNTVYREEARILRLIFKRSILARPKNLTPIATQVIEEIYKILSLVETESKVLISDFLGLEQAEIDDVKSWKKAEELGVDLINYSGVDTGFGYPRPAKLRWFVDVTTDDPFGLIRSKKLKKHLKYWRMKMRKYGLRYEVINDITSKEFNLWFEKYQSILQTKNKANIRINPKWLYYKYKTGKRVGAIFLYKDRKLLGGNIFIYTDSGFTVGYGVVEKIESPNWSLGALVDFLSLQKGMQMGYKKIGFGQDNNLYGYHLSTGLLRYKLNFGLTPGYKETGKIYSTKFVKMDKFDDELIFFGLKDGKYVFYRLVTNDPSTAGRDKEQSLNTDLEVVTVVR